MRERIIYDYMMERRRGIDSRAPSCYPATTTYLAPTQHVSDDEPWTQPVETTATRKLTTPSRGHSRGFVMDPISDRQLVFESMLECSLAQILVADRRVAMIEDQPAAVSYLDDDGRLRRHTFDFRVTTRTGKRIAIAVKPSRRVERSGLPRILQQIQMQTGNAFADHFLIRTEKLLTANRRFNADFVIRSLRARNDGDVETVRAIVRSLNGTIEMRDVVGMSGLGARGLCAIACLVYEGVLEIQGTERIGPYCPVRFVTGGGI
jgi:hypothetical protein